jgi:hypothetical protein
MGTPFVSFFNDRIQALGLFFKGRGGIRFNAYSVIGEQLFLGALKVALLAKFDQPIGNFGRGHEVDLSVSSNGTQSVGAFAPGNCRFHTVPTSITGVTFTV